MTGAWPLNRRLRHDTRGRGRGRRGECRRRRRPHLPAGLPHSRQWRAQRSRPVMPRRSRRHTPPRSYRPAALPQRVIAVPSPGGRAWDAPKISRLGEAGQGVRPRGGLSRQARPSLFHRQDTPPFRRGGRRPLLEHHLCSPPSIPIRWRLPEPRRPTGVNPGPTPPPSGSWGQTSAAARGPRPGIPRRSRPRSRGRPEVRVRPSGPCP